jgi:HIP---CoA ligase
MNRIDTIPHIALDSAWRFRDRVAMVDPGRAPIRYEALETLMMESCSAFLAAGLRRGDRVAIWAPNSSDWIIAALGLQASGAVLVPLNTRLKSREAAYILNASGARVLLTVASFLGNDYPAMIRRESMDSLERIVLLDGEAGGESWLDFLEAGKKIPQQRAISSLAELRSDDLSDILFTSGTTGNPKGVMTNHNQNVSLYRVYAGGIGWKPEDRLLAVNPFFNSFGYKAGWLCSLICGGTVHPMAYFNAADALDQVERHRITLIPGPPTIYQQLLDLPREDRDLTSLRVAITGATIVPVPLVRRMRDELGFGTVLTAYGLTETCGVVSMCAGTDSLELIANTAGRALPGIAIRIVGREGDDVPPGVAGEILVRGPNVMLGYLNDPLATSETIDAEGWLKTGDIGLLTQDNCIKITDRSKDVFIVGGFNVYPAEVEQVLATHRDVAEVAVIGVPDAKLGEVGHAFIVLRPHANANMEALIAWSRDVMANYKVPRVITFVASLPRNAAGKLMKFKLRQV